MVLPEIIGGCLISNNFARTLCGGWKIAFESPGTLKRDLDKAGRLPGKWDHFGRFTPDAQLFCIGCALALEDAGINTETARKRSGIVTADNFEHELDQQAYFKDYVDAGRQLGRSSLFVHTLPTSAAADASVCLQIGGPLLYSRDDAGIWPGLIMTAAGLLAEANIDSIITACRGGDSLLCLVMAESGRIGTALLNHADTAAQLPETVFNLLRALLAESQGK